MRIEIIPLEPDQRLYLRREASVSPCSFPVLFGGYPFARTNTSIFQQSLGYKQVCCRDFAMLSDSIYRVNPLLFVLQQLHRSWHLVESFAASFCALNFIGGVRSVIPFLLDEIMSSLSSSDPRSSWASWLAVQLLFGISVFYG